MKKLTKISAVLLSVNLFAQALPSVNALAAFKFSEPIFENATAVISTPQWGFVKTTITAENQGEEKADACIVVATTDSKTGDVKNISSESKSIKAGASDTLSAGIADFADGQTYNYYLWDNIINHTPLRNTPPTDVKNLEATSKMHCIDLEWDKANDDKGNVTYVITANGEEIAKTQKTSYSIWGLDKDKTYKIEVTAMDEAEYAETPAKTTASLYNTGMEECILSVNDNTNFYFKEITSNSIDSFTTKDEETGGRVSYENTYQTFNGNTKYCGFYFPVESSFISQNMRKVAIEVTYYDYTTLTKGEHCIKYNAADGSVGKAYNLDAITNTKTWKTVYAQIDDAKFVNSGDLSGSSFKVFPISSLTKGTGTRVYKVSLCPGEYYSPDVPSVKAGYENAGFVDTYDMKFYPADSVEKYDTVEDVPIMISKKGKAFEFDIKDARAKECGGYIEVNFYDNCDDYLVLNYDGAKTPQKVKFDNTDEFKTVQIPLTDANFKNGITGVGNKKFDFTLSTENGNPLSINYVKYVPRGGEAQAKTKMSLGVSSDGSKTEGDLTLRRWFSSIWSQSDSYDRMIVLSGEASKGSDWEVTKRDAIDGKHYMYNFRYTKYGPSGNSWKQWKNTWYVDIPDTFLSGTDYDTVKISIDYYIPTESDAGKMISLMVNNDSAKYQQAVSYGGWQTATFTISKNDGKNSTFNSAWSSNDAGGPSKIKIVPEQFELYIHKITVEKVND